MLNGRRLRSVPRPMVADRTAPNPVLRSGGEPLEAGSKAAMETIFAHDFSQVRIHADSGWSDSVAGLESRAYTVGNHIAVAAGSEGPVIPPRVLAHELVHVVQQKDAVRRPIETGPISVTHPDDPVEREATALSEWAMQGRTVDVRMRSGVALALDKAGDSPQGPRPQLPRGGEGKMVPLIDEDLGRSTLISTGSEEFRRNYIDANIQTVDYWSTAYADQEARFRDFWVNYSDGRRLQFSLNQIPVRYEIKQEPGSRRVRLTTESPRYTKRGGFIYPVFYGFGTVPRLIDIATTVEFNHQQRKKFLEVAELSFTFGVKILPAYVTPPEMPRALSGRPPAVRGLPIGRVPKVPRVSWQELVEWEQIELAGSGGRVPKALREGSHLFDRHIMISDELLQVRATKVSEGVATKFLNEERAVSAINEVLQKNAGDLQSFLSRLGPGQAEYLELTAVLEKEVGYGYRATAGVPLQRLADLRRVLVVIQADGVGHFLVRTAFPVP